MAAKPPPEVDDELFNEVYGKAYTGPPGSSVNGPERSKTNKKPMSNDQSDVEDELKDPNAVPTDFTSREAKVWEAKAKATERNWKKRKEEEMICKICGESGHFTQGCPSTLGGNRKSADFFERVAARDKHVRSLFSEKVIGKIERETGCKIKMDERFLIVSGKDRLILVKGVDAVHKVIQEGDKDEKKSHTSPPRNRSWSPEGRHGPPSRIRSRSPQGRHGGPPRNRSRSPEGRHAGSHFRRSDSQKSHSSPRAAPFFPQKVFPQDRGAEDQMREDLKRLRGSPQAYNDGARRGKSPQNAAFSGNVYGSYDGSRRNGLADKISGWSAEGLGSELHSGHIADFSSCPQTLEELETEFKKEAMECGRLRDKEEDEENYKHRECIRELRENYMKKLAIMRGMHTKQWDEFLQLENKRRQQPRYTSFNHPSYPEYERLSGNRQYMGSVISMDPAGRYLYPGEDLTASRVQEAYGQFQRQQHDEFGKSYGRY